MAPPPSPPLEQAKSVLTEYREYVKDIPEDLTIWVVMRKAPPLPFLPEEVYGKEVVVMAACYVGALEDGQKLFDPIRKFGTPHGEHVGVQPFTAWQAAFDPLLTPGARNYWESHNFKELSDGFFDALIEFTGKLPSPHNEVFIGPQGGRLGFRWRRRLTLSVTRNSP